MIKENNGYNFIKHLDFTILDLFALLAAFGLSYLFYFKDELTREWNNYKGLILILVLIDIVVDFVLQNHKDILRRGWYIEAVETLKQVSSVMILLLVTLFMLKRSSTYSRIILTGTWVGALLITYIFRCILKYYLLKYHVQKKHLPHAIIITSRENAKDCIINLKDRRLLDVNIRGLVLLDDAGVSECIEEIPVVADKTTFFAYAMEHVVDEVFVDVDVYNSELRKFIDTIVEMGITVKINLNQLYTDIPNKRVEEFNGYTVLATSVRTMDMRQRFIKRTMDIVGGLVGCILTLVAFIFVAPVIFIKDPGPIFFKQERVGMNGRKFKMYKFRSMYLDADEKKKELMKLNEMDDEKMFKLDEDPRILGSRFVEVDGKKVYKTGIGNFIRKYSIDELPQFFNVLKGDMSLVGTRPPLVSEVELYDPHHKGRLGMRPGITGLWQVSGRSEITDFEEVVRLDKEYISGWSLSLDAKILFKTIFVVLTARGAK